MTHDEQQTIQTIADAGADAVARWRASKQAQRASRYRQRMEGNRVKLPQLQPWLQAVDHDDQHETEKYSELEHAA